MEEKGGRRGRGQREVGRTCRMTLVNKTGAEMKNVEFL